MQIGGFVWEKREMRKIEVVIIIVRRKERGKLIFSSSLDLFPSQDKVVDTGVYITRFEF